MQHAAPDLYMNMQQFSDLKLQARQHSPDAAKAAAQQFEGLFVQMMLKNMRAAATLDESLHSSTMDFYTEMYDKQLALELSRQGGIGIAGLLQQQMPGGTQERQKPAPAEGLKLPQYRLPVQHSQSLPMRVMDYQPDNPAVRVHPLGETANAQSGQGSSTLRSEEVKPFQGWSNARQFVTDLWPHAESAAKQLGVSAQVLVAQSALETGWGQHAMRKPDGAVAFNLFGIKAGPDWAGDSVAQRTLEYRQGTMQKETAQFRSYDSVTEALDDYVDFVQSRPRYSGALEHGGSDENYIRGLHRAGYATDPAYADKIISIMKGETFNDALAALQNARQVVS